jgi:hypothetical protein
MFSNGWGSSISLATGDAVLGDARRAEGFLEDDVASRGAEGRLDGAGELARARRDFRAGVDSNLICFAAI